ncbi:MAG TPA: hypothetical protein VFA21_22505 [Pyrinomonadaceae bacterium]|nr:hypothetical protein [Pyrinomonadaceae bacterium]
MTESVLEPQLIVVGRAFETAASLAVIEKAQSTGALKRGSPGRFAPAGASS